MNSLYVKSVLYATFLWKFAEIRVSYPLDKGKERGLCLKVSFRTPKQLLKRMHFRYAVSHFFIRWGSVSYKGGYGQYSTVLFALRRVLLPYGSDIASQFYCASHSEKGGREWQRKGYEGLRISYQKHCTINSTLRKERKQCRENKEFIIFHSI